MASFIRGFATGFLRSANQRFDDARAAQAEKDAFYREQFGNTLQNYNKRMAEIAKLQRERDSKIKTYTAFLDDPELAAWGVDNDYELKDLEKFKKVPNRKPYVSTDPFADEMDALRGQVRSGAEQAGFDPKEVGVPAPRWVDPDTRQPFDPNAQHVAPVAGAEPAAPEAVIEPGPRFEFQDLPDENINKTTVEKGLEAFYNGDTEVFPGGREEAALASKLYQEGKFEAAASLVNPVYKPDEKTDNIYKDQVERALEMYQEGHTEVLGGADYHEVLGLAAQGQWVAAAEKLGHRNRTDKEGQTSADKLYNRLVALIGNEKAIQPGKMKQFTDAVRARDIETASSLLADPEEAGPEVGDNILPPAISNSVGRNIALAYGGSIAIDPDTGRMLIEGLSQAKYNRAIATMALAERLITDASMAGVPYSIGEASEDALRMNNLGISTKDYRESYEDSADRFSNKDTFVGERLATLKGRDSSMTNVLSRYAETRSSKLKKFIEDALASPHPSKFVSASISDGDEAAIKLNNFALIVDSINSGNSFTGQSDLSEIAAEVSLADDPLSVLDDLDSSIINRMLEIVEATRR